MKRPVLKETVVEIVRSGQYYIILLGKHISITWDTGTRISLQINGQYRVTHIQRKRHTYTHLTSYQNEHIP